MRGDRTLRQTQGLSVAMRGPWHAWHSHHTCSRCDLQLLPKEIDGGGGVEADIKLSKLTGGETEAQKGCDLPWIPL